MPCCPGLGLSLHPPPWPAVPALFSAPVWCAANTCSVNSECAPCLGSVVAGLAVPLAKQGHPIPFRFPQYPPTIFDNLTSIVLEPQGLFRLFPDFYGFSAEIEVYPSWCARAASGGCAVACGLRWPWLRLCLGRFFLSGQLSKGKGEKSRGVLLTLLPSVSQIKSYQSNSPSYKGYADNSLFHFLLLPIFQFLASNY